MNYRGFVITLPVGNGGICGYCVTCSRGMVVVQSWGYHSHSAKAGLIADAQAQIDLQIAATR